jgi:hypothetical protein
MLPVFPKCRKILDDEWKKNLFAAKAEVFPYELHPPVLPVVEGKHSDYQRRDRKIVPLEMKRSEVSTSIDTSQGLGMTIETFREKARELGQGFGKQMWEMVIGAVEQAVAETGYQVKVRKGNLTQQDVLKMFDLVEHNFDEAGNPTQQLVLGPELAAEFKKRFEEWSQDTAFMEKLEDIKQRKRLEFNEREARRRLVE